MFGVCRRFEFSGFVKQNDRRRGLVRELVVHRNTVSELYRAAHPAFDGDDLEATARWYRRPTDGSKRWRLFPYHFFIDGAEGHHPIIYQVHTLDTKAPHARGRNATSVAVCLNIDGRKRAPSQNAQLAAAWLLASLLEFCPAAQIARHRDEGEYACPGGLVDVDGLSLNAAEMYDQLGPATLRGSGVLPNRVW